MRRYDDPVETRMGQVAGTEGPEQFLWRGRLWKVRAVLAHDTTSARLSREHNDANVVAFGQRVIGVEVAREALKVFLNTPFEGGRHAGRVAKLSGVAKS